MTVSERIRTVRELYGGEKKISQEAFGKVLGVSRSVISNLEYGKVEPPESIIKLICATCNVNREWLVDGIGEMRGSEDNTLAAIDSIMAGENDTAKAIFKAFAQLDDSDWLTVKKIIDSLQKK